MTSKQATRNSNSTPQALVFDLDDTLYLERDFVFSGYEAVARAFADELDAPFDLLERMKQLFDSPDRGRVYNVIADQLGHPDPDALVPRMIDTYRNHPPNIQLQPDAAAALTRLAGRCRLGLISDGPATMQANKVRTLGLDSRLDEIILTDQWGREFWKPHPRAFQEMAQKLDVPPTACLYVADNPAKDFLAPNALGWTTVQIRRPGGIYHDNTPAKDGHPQRAIDTLDAIILP
ncbi:MAG: HAD family hydrolase [Phycisphaerae bacterium]